MTATLRLPTSLRDANAIRAALDEVADPEIPNVSIVELGMIGRIAANDRSIQVELLPTFVGCPALDLIRTSIEDCLAGDGRDVRVGVSFSTPWSSDRISPAGREKLRRSGFAAPPSVRAGRALPMLDLPSLADEVVPCPFCGSERTTLESPFGPTQCRSIRHCDACRQPFEAFKAI